MLFRLFDHFKLNYHDFMQFSLVFHAFGRVWEHQETQGGWAMTAIPSYGMLLRLFDHFKLNYDDFMQFSLVFHAFGRVWEL